MQVHGREQDLRVELSTLPMLAPSPGSSLVGKEDLQTETPPKSSKTGASRPRSPGTNGGVTQGETPARSPGMHPCLPARLIRAIGLLEALVQAGQHQVAGPHTLPARLGLANLFDNRVALFREADSGYCLYPESEEVATGFLRLPEGSVGQNPKEPLS